MKTRTFRRTRATAGKFDGGWWIRCEHFSVSQINNAILDYISVSATGADKEGARTFGRVPGIKVYFGIIKMARY